jgi:hypothetical protein
MSSVFGGIGGGRVLFESNRVASAVTPQRAQSKSQTTFFQAPKQISVSAQTGNLENIQRDSPSPATMVTAKAAAPIFRAQLRSRPANGHGAFVPQIRKLVLEYCDMWSSSANTRTYILNHVQELARANPHVEIVVRHRFQNEPIARGFYRSYFSFWYPFYILPLLLMV